MLEVVEHLHGLRFYHGNLDPESVLVNVAEDHNVILSNLIDFSDYEACYGDAPSPNYKKQYYFRYDQKPVLLNPLCIDYPSSAKTRNVEGEVILEGSISSKGNVSHYPSIDIIKRTGTVLDQAAIDAFIFSLWEPAISKDRPIKTKYRLKIEFSLDSDCIKIEEFRDP